jgi:hypothetical protein
VLVIIEVRGFLLGLMIIEIIFINVRDYRGYYYINYKN